MAGAYDYITQDFEPVDDCRDYRSDTPGAPDKSDGREGKTIIVGRTHGCGCCSSDKILTVADIDEHIRRLKEDLERAEKAKEVILANQ